ncbi:MAG TPA: ABC transporter ATP-binding protein [Usitatibacter sp.]|nr:ABC transporter ATP-binding protein [Usitatibacter sp.]
MSLEARGLAFGFRDRRVGEGLDARLEHGEVTCLLGPNGSGKTTLMRTLLGFLPPLAGEIVLDGHALHALGPRERARRMAYVPQAAESYFDFTVCEMVEMGRTAHRGLFARATKADHGIAHRALDRLGVDRLSERPIQRVSGGERQLVLIARALATEASVLLMDEPTANLDFANQSRVLDEIARLRADGTAVLFTTHHPDHALRIADRVILLREGRVLASGPALSAVNSTNLSALYGQPIDVLEVASPHAGPVRVCVARGGARFD